MELSKGYILLAVFCGLIYSAQCRPHDKKKAVKNWWDEDWDQYFPPKQTDNLIAEGQYHKSADSKLPVKSEANVASKGTEKIVDNKSTEKIVDSKGLDHVDSKGVPKVDFKKPSLYHPIEENRFSKFDEYDKFVEDEYDEKDYEDYNDVDDDSDEDVDDEEYSDEDYSDEEEEEEEEEADYKEIGDAKAYKAAQKKTDQAQVESEKKPPAFNRFETEIDPEDVSADVKDAKKEQNATPKEAPIQNYVDDSSHSVKKDLMNPAYMKEFTNTKPDLKTSPNPPPPGLDDTKVAMVTPSGKKLVEEQKMTLIQSRPLTMCQVNADCRVGRMCHEKMCFCLPSDGCEGHFKPVCGSDNLWYPSHCELHRMACVRGQHIKIDHSGACFKGQDKVNKAQVSEKKESQPVIDKTEIDIDSEIPQDAIKSPIINSGEIYDYPKGSSKNFHIAPKDEEVWPKAPVVEGKGAEKKKECLREDYEFFKLKLLQFHCKKFKEPNCRTEIQEEREYLATLMFNFYDRDLDFYLELEEAKEMEKKEKFHTLSVTCEIADIIRFADSNPIDNKLSISEFIAAFNGSIEAKKDKEENQVITTLATVGNGLELKCGSSSNVIWRRFGTDIRELKIDQLTVFEDGSLFFSKVGVHHMGNYSCENINNPLQQQIHTLRVQMPPIVQVSPSSLMTESDATIMLKCHAEGLPKPKIFWKVNEVTIPDAPDHYIKTHENGTLTVQKADYLRDTGAYKCVAKNQAGEAEDVASVFVQNPNKTHTYTNTKLFYGSFVAFHNKGYTVYEPERCLLEREVGPEFGNFKFIPDNIDAPLHMCDIDQGCEWGGAATVGDFVYATQPKLNRIVVVETARKWNPIQVIDTDKRPMAVQYVAHLDQVWVLCWNGDDDGSLKTIVVVRDASKYIQHHAVHMQPVGNRFDMVQNLFLPTNNDLHHAFNHGYVTHSNQQGMFKVDLKAMKYVKGIDFTAYNCIPQTLAFVPIGGHVIVECISQLTHETTQLVMDYLTDDVVSRKAVAGKPYVSPNSRHIVTVDEYSGRVSVFTITDDGTLESEFEVTLSSRISDTAFFPSPVHDGYDIVLTSVDDENIFFLSLVNGQLDKIKRSAGMNDDWKPQILKKNLVAGGMFNDYLLGTLPSSVRIINGKQHHIQCTFNGPVNSHVIVAIKN